MAEEFLKITIDADVDKARTGIQGVSSDTQELVGNLNKVPSAASSASGGFDKLADSSKQAGQATDQSTSGIQKLVGGLTKLPPIVNSSADSTKKFVTQLKETNSVLVNVASGTPKTTQQITKLQLGVSALGDSLETLKAKASVTRDFINTERDTARIVVLQKQLQALEGEIERVQAIGKEGVGINASGFQGLVGGANEAFTALRRIAFILPGIGVAGILGGLTDGIIALGKELFNVSDGFDQAEIQAAQFQSQLKSLDEFINSTKGDLDFSAEINKLKAQLTFGPGFQVDVLGKAIDVKTAEDKLKNLNTVLDIQFKNLEGLLGNSTNVLSKKGRELFDSFNGVPDLISDDLIQKLNKNDQQFLNNIKAVSADISKINKERGELQRQIEAGNLQQQVDAHNQQLKEQKEAHDKQLKENQEFIRKTIDLAKEAEKFFNIPIELHISNFETQTEQFKKALDTIIGIREFEIKLKTDIVLPDIKELPKEQVEKFFINVPDALQDAIQKGIIQAPEGITFPVKLDLDPEHAFDKDIAALEAKFNNLGIEIPVDIQLAIADGKLKGVDLFDALQKALKPAELEKKLHDKIQDTINQSFQNITVEGLTAIGETIGAALSGGDLGNAFAAFGKAIGQAVETIGKQLVALGAAALLAKNALKTLFVNPVTTIIAGVALIAIGRALESLLGGGLKGFAKGGRPSVGEWVMVGEKGPELLKLDKPGTVYNNQQTQSMLSNVSSAVKHFITNHYYNHTQIINNFFGDISKSISTANFSPERIANILKIPKLATGGAVFAPTLALLGEGFGISRSNPEFVGTRDQLKGIQGGTFDVNVNVDGDISFDIGKLALALNRQTRSQLRTNGKKPF